MMEKTDTSDAMFCDFYVCVPGKEMIVANVRSMFKYICADTRYPVREQVVVNTRFVETYHLIGVYDDETQFMCRREMYDAELPHGVLGLTAAVDVQGNRLEYEICGWGFGEECWGIQKGVIPGNPDHPKVWQFLDNILDRPYHFKDGSLLKILRTFIDTGGLSTLSIYEYCKKNLYKQRIGINGWATQGMPLVDKVNKDRKGYNLPLQF